MGGGGGGRRECEYLTFSPSAFPTKDREKKRRKRSLLSFSPNIEKGEHSKQEYFSCQIEMSHTTKMSKKCPLKKHPLDVFEFLRVFFAFFFFQRTQRKGTFGHLVAS